MNIEYRNTNGQRNAVIGAEDNSLFGLAEVTQWLHMTGNHIVWNAPHISWASMNTPNLKRARELSSALQVALGIAEEWDEVTGKVYIAPDEFATHPQPLTPAPAPVTDDGERVELTDIQVLNLQGSGMERVSFHAGDVGYSGSGDGQLLENIF